MSDEPQTPPGEPGGPPGGEQPDEAELRRRIEESMREVRLQDVLLESVVTIVNLTARRIGKEDERDLEQARVGIDAVRALLDLLEPEPQAQVRNALSELQVLYARYAGGADSPEAPPEPPDGAGEGGEGGGGTPPPQGGGAPPQQGPPRGGEPPPRLWTPPGT